MVARTASLLDLSRFPAECTVGVLTDSDLPDAVRIANEMQARVNGDRPHTVENWKVELEWDGMDRERDTICVHLPDGRVCGFGMVANVDETHHVSWLTWGIDDALVGHPDPEIPPAGESALLEALISVAESRIDEAEPDVRIIAQTIADVNDQRAATLAARHGFTPERYFLRMKVDLAERPVAPALPDGLALKALSETENLDAIALATEDGFRDHFGHVNQSDEQVIKDFRHVAATHPRFDPSLWYAIYDGSDIAAICLNVEKMDEAPEIGYVSTLAVRRPWRKRGLGKLLLLYSFAALWDRGQRSVALHVDAQSLTGATRLYENVGMVADRREVSLVRTIRDGKDIRNLG